MMLNVLTMLLILLALPSTGSGSWSPVKTAFGLTCPPGTTFDSSLNQCDAPPTCPAGTVFVSTGSNCQGSSSLECPAGSTFNGADNACEVTPTCPSGTASNGFFC